MHDSFHRENAQYLSGKRKAIVTICTRPPFGNDPINVSTTRKAIRKDQHHHTRLLYRYRRRNHHSGQICIVNRHSAAQIAFAMSSSQHAQSHRFIIPLCPSPSMPLCPFFFEPFLSVLPAVRKYLATQLDFRSHRCQLAIASFHFFLVVFSLC